MNRDGIADSIVLSQSGRVCVRLGLPHGGGFGPARTINPTTPARCVAVARLGARTVLATVDQSATAPGSAGGDRLTLYSPGGRVLRRLSVPALSDRIATVDVNHDGCDDLVVTGTLSGRLSIFLGNPRGPLVASQSIDVPLGLSDLAAVNLGNGQAIDLVLANQGSGQVNLLSLPAGGESPEPDPFYAAGGTYRVEGAGAAMQVRSTEQLTSLAVGDFDEDGTRNVVVGNAGSLELSLLSGKPAGTLVNPVRIPIGERPDLVRAADLNADGHLDLAVLDKTLGTVSVWLGDGHGGFAKKGTFGAGNRPTGFSIADAGGDRKLDFLVGNEYGDLLILRGRGDGTFRPFVRSDRGLALAKANVNGDGRDELILSNELLDRVTVQAGRPGQAFGPGFSAGRSEGVLDPGAVKVADLDGDGRNDLILANTGGNNVLVYLGLGNGRFADAQRFFAGTGPAGLTIADVNGDGRLDVLVANRGSNNVSVLLGDRQDLLRPGVRLRRFGAVATAVGDFDRDGKADLLVANQGSNNVFLLPGIGNGFFNDQAQRVFPTGLAPSDLLVGLFDGTSNLGFATINRDSNSVTVFSGLGLDRILTMSSGGSSPLSGLVADVNGNRFDNLLVANSGDGVISLLLNNQGRLAPEQSLTSAESPHPAAMALALMAQSEGMELLIVNQGSDAIHSFWLDLRDRGGLDDGAISPMPGDVADLRGINLWMLNEGEEVAQSAALGAGDGGGPGLASLATWGAMAGLAFDVLLKEQILLCGENAATPRDQLAATRGPSSEAIFGSLAQLGQILGHGLGLDNALPGLVRQAITTGRTASGPSARCSVASSIGARSTSG